MLTLAPIELLGILGGGLTTFAGLPQIYKTIKTRDTKGVSQWTFVMMFFGALFWMLYGLAIGSFSVIVWDFIGCCTYLIVVYVLYTTGSIYTKNART